MSKIASITQATAAAALILSASLEAAPLPGFALAAQTSRLSFYSRGGAKVEADKAERFVSTLEQTLGTSFNGRAEYYRYDTPEQLEVATGSYAQGITYSGRKEVHSVQAFHAHELVHLVAGQMGDPGSFFQEGLAVALGNEGRWNGTDVEKLAKKLVKPAAIRTIVDRFDALDAQQAYPVAGAFVKSLIKTYGVEKVADFFRSCPKPQSRDAAFQQTFGVTLAQATTEWAERL
jgi:hypothetical protein